MGTNKFSTDFRGFIVAAGIGILGLLGFSWSNSKGYEGEGMEIAKMLSIMFLLIGVIGMAVTKYFEKHPIKKLGVMNQEDEMSRLIRYKAAYATLQVTVPILLLAVILIAAQVIKLSASLYIVGVAVVVFIEVLQIVFTVVYSAKSV